MVFTRDLRLRDNPALCAALAGAQEVVPLFVIDDDVITGAHSAPNRLHFLADSLADLDSSLREAGGHLVIRRGNWVEEVSRVVAASGSTTIHLAEDHSAYAKHRVARLRAALADLGATVALHPGTTVVPPGATAPTSGGPWKVFSPFHRRWAEYPWRAVDPPPQAVRVPDEVAPGEVPDGVSLCSRATSGQLPRGGESTGLALLRDWAASSLAGYEEAHNDLAGDLTSRISPYLHFGCLSPLEVATRLRERPGGAPFVRQLCWRDFYHQVLSDRPETARHDVRPRGDEWRDDPDDLRAWKEGRTGFPVVDAGMRQLLAEGFMHNRARMVVASFLTKDLYIDWRHGADHFMEWLVDGDVANNNLNWQWVAGTGTDSNPHRIFNPTVQGTRFDPSGDYVRRYVPELAGLDARQIHDPSPEDRRRLGYPAPLVDHRSAIEAYRAVLAAQRERRG
jgi:deoxyribodipyrimidine photo-lyase